MREKPSITYLTDYQAPAYSIKQVFLTFDLNEDKTLVTTTMQCQRNMANDITSPLILNGKELKLLSVSLDDKPLSENDYKVEADKLILPNVPESFTLTIENSIKPQENTSLEGLYKSKGMFCTQCEAHGFRKITYYLDRPDVMSRFKTKIIADKKRYPVLLSNGNRIESGDLDNGRHFVTYEDPFKKPCYLFALVAGDLHCLQDTFTTQSGRNINLEFYASEQNIDKCHHALESLKKAMSWDETIYNREYDLDTYMVVAVADFNMGAMENKGLNIFNTSCILANPKTATDADYDYILRVIGHEYFHNWTGNRITLRDWFQLSLKEGLTVFRDQSFTEDHTSKTLKRISGVNLIRIHQFAEDRSPMRHPVRPESYIEMDNFYTTTVYYKGAEVIRMLKTIVGDEGFYKGMALYFSRHDGQAITCDDFVKAFEDANDLDLSQFMLWYAQDSTPTVTATDEYDEATQTYDLHFQQTCPKSPAQPNKKPFLIPIKLGFLSSQGDSLTATYNDQTNNEFVITLKNEKESVSFSNVSEKPTPSLLRDFSAPIKLKYAYTEKDHLLLFANDSNLFNRYEAGNQYMTGFIQRHVEAIKEGHKINLDDEFLNALKYTLQAKDLDKAFIAHAISIPTMNELIGSFSPIPIDAIHQAREYLSTLINTSLSDTLRTTYEALQNDAPYEASQEAIQARTLKNTCLLMLAEMGEKEIMHLCQQQFEQANNMSDQLAALKGLLYSQDKDLRQRSLDTFYQMWQHEALVMDKWFALQAQAKDPSTLDQVEKLTKHPAFDIKNPNKVRALMGTFSQQNLINFHQKEGRGYTFIKDQVITLDAINAHVASSLARSLMNFKRFEDDRQKLMRESLESLLQAKLSNNVYEIVSKSLAD